MIRISIGNVGSGKTASEVKEMALNLQKRFFYSNIKTTLKHTELLKPEYIAKKIEVGAKKGMAIYDYKVNLEFWKNLKVPISVVLDEAHNIVDSRRSMSKLNQVVTKWQSGIRRVLGATEGGYGELVYITQLPMSIDSRIRDLATQIRYHICHYQKTCKNCKVYWFENSEMPEERKICPVCMSNELVKHNHVIEIMKFGRMSLYEQWQTDGSRTFYDHYLITDIEKFFNLYDTLQWDNLFEDY